MNRGLVWKEQRLTGSSLAKAAVQLYGRAAKLRPDLGGLWADAGLACFTVPPSLTPVPHGALP